MVVIPEMLASSHWLDEVDDTAWPPANVADRRGGPRYLAKVVDAWLTWQCPRTREPVATPALILEFSESGAFVVVDEAPDPQCSGWLGLDAPTSPLGVEARVVAVDSTKFGPHVLRLAFTTPCPYPLFKAVVLGRRDQDAPRA